MKYSAAIPTMKVARPSPTNALSLSALLGGVRAQAACTYPRPDRASGHGYASHLQVGQEPPVDPVLGVTDVVSVQRLFAANRAMLGHDAPFVGDLTQNDEKPVPVPRDRIVPWAIHGLEDTHGARPIAAMGSRGGLSISSGRHRRTRRDGLLRHHGHGSTRIA